MKLTRRSLVAVLVALSVPMVAWAIRQPWNAQPINVNGLLIQPTEIYSNGRGILTVHTTFINSGTVPIAVNRDLISALLPTGRSIPRGQGTFTQHETYVIPGGGGSHAVWVDFNQRDVTWEAFSSLQVVWGQSVSANGAPLSLPPLMLSP